MVDEFLLEALQTNLHCAGVHESAQAVSHFMQENGKRPEVLTLLILVTSSEVGNPQSEFDAYQHRLQFIQELIPTAGLLTSVP